MVDRLPQAPPSVVFIANCVSFVVFISDAVFDPTLTIGGYVVLSLLMLWALFLALDAAMEMQAAMEARDRSQHLPHNDGGVS